MLEESELEQLALFANEAFYLAFEAKDFAAMSHLWSATLPVVCLHPGWPALLGRDAVLESWQHILANPGQGQVSFYGATPHLLTQDAVMVTCYEQAGDAVMVATNTFVREPDGVKLCSHQAGYCAQPPGDG